MIHDQVRVVDILPTLLDAVGVPIPESLDGVSLLPLLRGEPPPEPWVYGESGRSFRGTDPERYIQGVAEKHRMIRTPDWKLIFIPRPNGGNYRLFDLRADPEETTDVAARHPDVVARLRVNLAHVRASERERAADRSLSSDEIDQLRELGYVE